MSDHAVPSAILHPFERIPVTLNSPNWLCMFMAPAVSMTHAWSANGSTFTELQPVQKLDQFNILQQSPPSCECVKAVHTAARHAPPLRTVRASCVLLNMMCAAQLLPGHPSKNPRCNLPTHIHMFCCLIVATQSVSCDQLSPQAPKMYHQLTALPNPPTLLYMLPTHQYIHFAVFAAALSAAHFLQSPLCSFQAAS